MRSSERPLNSWGRSAHVFFEEVHSGGVQRLISHHTALPGLRSSTPHLAAGVATSTRPRPAGRFGRLSRYTHIAGAAVVDFDTEEPVVPQAELQAESTPRRDAVEEYR